MIANMNRRLMLLLLAPLALSVHGWPLDLISVRRHHGVQKGLILHRQWYTRGPTTFSFTSRQMTRGLDRQHRGGDMAYISENITRQMLNYDNIRKAGGKDVANDVYVRNPKLPSLLWYVGKVARCTGTVSLEIAISKQWNLVEEHAARLRPVELGRDFGTLEVWCAPGDSEVEMEENNPNFRFVKMEKYVPNVNEVQLVEMGFKPEIVTSNGQGFRVERTREELML